MVVYTSPQKSKQEEKRTAKRRERDQIKFIDLRFERWQVKIQESKKKARCSINCIYNCINTFSLEVRESLMRS